MLSDFLGSIWRRTPKFIKRNIMTMTHPRFAVTVGAIITDDQGRVLLFKHHFRPGSGWGMPGGYIDKHEQPLEALHRELQEEVGLELKNVELFTTRAFSKPLQVEIIFRSTAVGEPAQLNYEIEKAEWFLPNALPPQLPKDQKELIERAFADGANRQD
ncbi:MAG TPA: NUDIX domain-containing protein [Pyrinomonadaceae bacterium]|nr:NUDIX domain-containing protein [Pyrinomonadaceae bacterium]